MSSLRSQMTRRSFMPDTTAHFYFEVMTLAARGSGSISRRFTTRPTIASLISVLVQATRFTSRRIGECLHLPALDAERWRIVESLPRCLDRLDILAASELFTGVQLLLS